MPAHIGLALNQPRHQLSKNVFSQTTFPEHSAPSSTLWSLRIRQMRTSDKKFVMCEANLFI